MSPRGRPATDAFLDITGEPIGPSYEDVAFHSYEVLTDKETASGAQTPTGAPQALSNQAVMSPLRADDGALFEIQDEHGNVHRIEQWTPSIEEEEDTETFVRSRSMRMNPVESDDRSFLRRRSTNTSATGTSDVLGSRLRVSCLSV